MIVAPGFEGDDMEVAWKQHEAYYHALEIIISTCNSHIHVARNLLQTSVRPEWGNVKSCDHRTLQGAHDRLAIVWRYQNDFRQKNLLTDDNKTLDDVIALWLDWLRREIENWYSSPHLVISVQSILTNQNDRIGYLAENKLRLDIMARFSQVPWDRDEYDSLQKSLAKFEE